MSRVNPQYVRYHAAAALRAEVKAAKDRHELFAVMLRAGAAEQAGEIDEDAGNTLNRLYTARLDMFCGRLRGVEEVRRLTKRRRDARRGMAA